MSVPDETTTSQEKAAVYSYSLSEQEIKTRRDKSILAKIGVVLLLVALLYGGYRVWSASIKPVNKFGVLALVVFLAFYLGRFTFTRSSDSAVTEHRLVIDERGVALNHNFVEWALIDQAELKNQRDGNYLELSVKYQREGYTAPAQSYLFIWQIDRYGDREQIIADLNQYLQTPVKV